MRRVLIASACRFPSLIQGRVLRQTISQLTKADIDAGFCETSDFGLTVRESTDSQSGINTERRNRRTAAPGIRCFKRAAIRRPKKCELRREAILIAIGIRSRLLADPLRCVAKIARSTSGSALTIRRLSSGTCPKCVSRFQPLEQAGPFRSLPPPYQSLSHRDQRFP
jgi:hypothetical protein